MFIHVAYITLSSYVWNFRTRRIVFKYPMSSMRLVCSTQGTNTASILPTRALSLAQASSKYAQFGSSQHPPTSTVRSDVNVYNKLSCTFGNSICTTRFSISKPRISAVQSKFVVFGSRGCTMPMRFDFSKYGMRLLRVRGNDV